MKVADSPVYLEPLDGQAGPPAYWRQRRHSSLDGALVLEAGRYRASFGGVTRPPIVVQVKPGETVEVK